MIDALPFVAAAIVFGGLAVWWRRASTRRQVLQRIRPVTESTVAPPAASLAPVIVDRSVLHAVLGGAVVLGVTWYLGFPLPLVLALAFIAAIGVHVVSISIADRRAFRMEEQLADSIDLMVSSLRSGVGMLDALENTVVETRGRFRALLEDVLARIRYGESPGAAVATMGDRVPLESFWLFSMTQRVHWEVGGAVAKNLAAVGVFVRDRLEMRRIMLAQSTQARVSMVFVAVLTYFIGAMVWRSNPARMEEFLSSSVGLAAVCGAVALQAFGALWITRLSRMKT